MLCKGIGLTGACFGSGHRKVTAEFLIAFRVSFFLCFYFYGFGGLAAVHDAAIVTGRNISETPFTLRAWSGVSAKVFNYIVITTCINGSTWCYPSVSILCALNVYLLFCTFFIFLLNPRPRAITISSAADA